MGAGAAEIALRGHAGGETAEVLGGVHVRRLREELDAEPQLPAAVEGRGEDLIGAPGDPREQPRHHGFRPQGDQIIQPASAYVITDMLEGVIDHGTARAARGAVKNTAMAGKTGTVRLALALGVRITPMVSWGSAAVWQKSGPGSLKPGRPVWVSVGDPIDLGAGQDAIHDYDAVRRMTADLMGVLTALTIDLRDRYPRRWADAR